MSDPQSILDPEFIEVTLCGRTYRWKMPSARDVREWASELASIEQMIQADPSRLFSGFNRMLDFFYTHNREMNKDRAVLDAATNAEIFKAEKELSEFIAPPLQRMNAGLNDLAANLKAKQNSDNEKSQPSNS